MTVSTDIIGLTAEGRLSVLRNKIGNKNIELESAVQARQLNDELRIRKELTALHRSVSWASLSAFRDKATELFRYEKFGRVEISKKEDNQVIQLHRLHPTYHIRVISSANTLIIASGVVACLTTAKHLLLPFPLNTTAVLNKSYNPSISSQNVQPKKVASNNTNSSLDRLVDKFNYQRKTRSEVSQSIGSQLCDDSSVTNNSTKLPDSQRPSHKGTHLPVHIQEYHHNNNNNNNSSLNQRQSTSANNSSKPSLEQIINGLDSQRRSRLEVSQSITTTQIDSIDVRDSSGVTPLEKLINNLDNQRKSRSDIGSSVCSQSIDQNTSQKEVKSTAFDDLINKSDIQRLSRIATIGTGTTTELLVSRFCDQQASRFTVAEEVISSLVSELRFVTQLDSGSIEKNAKKTDEVVNSLCNQQAERFSVAVDVVSNLVKELQFVMPLKSKRSDSCSNKASPLRASKEELAARDSVIKRFNSYNEISDLNNKTNDGSHIPCSLSDIRSVQSLEIKSNSSIVRRISSRKQPSFSTKVALPIKKRSQEKAIPAVRDSTIRCRSSSPLRASEAELRAHDSLLLRFTSGSGRMSPTMLRMSDIQSVDTSQDILTESSLLSYSDGRQSPQFDACCKHFMDDGIYEKLILNFDQQFKLLLDTSVVIINNGINQALHTNESSFGHKFLHQRSNRRVAASNLVQNVLRTATITAAERITLGTMVTNKVNNSCLNSKNVKKISKHTSFALPPQVIFDDEGEFSRRDRELLCLQNDLTNHFRNRKTISAGLVAEVLLKIIVEKYKSTDCRRALITNYGGQETPPGLSPEYESPLTTKEQLTESPLRVFTTAEGWNAVGDTEPPNLIGCGTDDSSGGVVVVGVCHPRDKVSLSHVSELYNDGSLDYTDEMSLMKKSESHARNDIDINEIFKRRKLNSLFLLPERRKPQPGPPPVSILSPLEQRMGDGSVCFSGNLSGFVPHKVAVISSISILSLVVAVRISSSELLLVVPKKSKLQPIFSPGSYPQTYFPTLRAADASSSPADEKI